MTNVDALNSLRNLAISLEVGDIASHVLNDPRFLNWSGSSKPNQHHYGKGGLCIHTHEVTNLCLLHIKEMNLNIDVVEMFLSALYHDCGKMWDYQPVYKYVEEHPRANKDEIYTNYSEWRSTDHKRLIHHISRSALEWNKACVLYGEKYNKYVDSVTHDILSHHGLRQWGSPVMPKTKAAWLLHLCDGISARMNDADKIDLVHEN